MKKIVFATLLIVSGFMAGAQSKPNFPKVAAPPRTIATATASSFESPLVQGTLILSKIFKQGDGKEFVTVYTLAKDDAYFNGRKPIQISLSRQSFDSVFTRTTADLAARWPALNKYVEDNKLSLTTEKAWMDVITHFNGMRY